MGKYYTRKIGKLLHIELDSDEHEPGTILFHLEDTFSQIKFLNEKFIILEEGIDVDFDEDHELIFCNYEDDREYDELSDKDVVELKKDVVRYLNEDEELSYRYGIKRIICERLSIDYNKINNGKN